MHSAFLHAAPAPRDPRQSRHRCDVARSSPSTALTAACAAICAALLLVAPSHADAQSENPTGNVTGNASSTSSTSADTSTANASADGDAGGIFGDKTAISIGMGIGTNSRYMGSRDFGPLIVPMLNISRGIFFADSVQGLGVQYQSPSGFYVGDAFNYDPGRDNADDWLRPGSDRLQKLGSVKGTITNTLTVSQQIIPSWLSVNAQAELGLDGHVRGNQYQFGLESIVLHQAHDTLTLDLNAKMGDNQYNQTYFGVTASQSRSSGFTRYSPGFGIYAYALTATWNHTFDKHWSAQFIVSGSVFTNKVADSDIVERAFGLTALPSVSYAF